MTLGTRHRLTGLLALLAALVAPLMTPTGARAVAAGEPTIVMLWTPPQEPEVVTRGSHVTVSGALQPNTQNRTVQLQRSVPGGWATVSAAVAPAVSGSISFTLPTSYYGSFTLRAFSPAIGTGAAATSSSHVLKVRPSYSPRGSASSHSFIVKPVARWNPCARIDYRVNVRSARPGALRDVKGAIQRIRYATGLKFHYAGRTRKVPTGKVGDRYPSGTELVIAWARPSATNMLGAGSTAAGRGGPVWTSGFVDGAGHPVPKIRQGGVVLNANLNSRIRNGFGTGQTRGELVMHEVGHALGLGHTRARGQIMYPTLQSGIARLEAGDLAGLNRVGAQQGCLVPASSGGVAARPATPRSWTLVSR